MNPLDFFLREHAAVHGASVASGDYHVVDWALDGLDDTQLRTRPHGLNSIAWLLWHLARVEDSCVATVVFGGTQLLDDAWVARLGVDHRDRDGDGMTKGEVSAVSDALDLASLRAYRDAVGTRTRTLASELWSVGRWDARLTEADLRAAAAAGALGGEDAAWLTGKAREELLAWWAVHHSYYHLGQAMAVRSLLIAP
ncbi:MAG: DUF664 domain-containing protein [Planctomycetes bacterium]|nr:DUF664 domain-containing protein [Planctomycetota bacterium]